MTFRDARLAMIGKYRVRWAGPLASGETANTGIVVGIRPRRDMPVKVSWGDSPLNQDCSWCHYNQLEAVGMPVIAMRGTAALGRGKRRMRI
jgi:hypothetical protein